MVFPLIQLKSLSTIQVVVVVLKCTYFHMPEIPEKGSISVGLQGWAHKMQSIH